MKKPYKITVIGPRETWTRKHMIDTTSKARGQWSTGLSPFYLGPVPLYKNYVARVMENAWQYSKVYPQFVHGDKISKNYFKWAKEGWANTRAVRYPMGKGKKPCFSLWENNRMDYVTARKNIYCILYARSVLSTEAFKILKVLHSERDIVLWDYDGYDHRQMGRTLEEVLNDPKKIMGHAFVLFMLLEILDRRRERAAARKMPCAYCGARPGSFKITPFYRRGKFRVFCEKCSKLIDPKWLRIE